MYLNISSNLCELDVGLICIIVIFAVFLVVSFTVQISIACCTQMGVIRNSVAQKQQRDKKPRRCCPEVRRRTRPRKNKPRKDHCSKCRDCCMLCRLKHQERHEELSDRCYNCRQRCANKCFDMHN